MSEIEFVSWVRGPGFQLAVIIFVAGVIIRLLEILLLGRKANLAEARGSAMQGGFRTIVSRSIPDKGTFKKSSFKIVSGYIFHIGLLVTIFFYTPHILFFKDVLGFSWPALPSAVIDVLAMVSIITLFAVLFDRLRNPVTRFLTTPQDLLIWFVTIFPLITGYMAFHRTGLSAPSLLGLHILSVELLLIVFPFTKLMHAFTFIMARWYNGAVSGYKGVTS